MSPLGGSSGLEEMSPVILPSDSISLPWPSPGQSVQPRSL